VYTKRADALNGRGKSIAFEEVEARDIVCCILEVKLCQHWWHNYWV